MGGVAQLVVAQTEWRPKDAPGQTIAAILEREGRFGPLQAVAYARQVAALMTGLHERGLVLGSVDLAQTWVSSHTPVGDVLKVQGVPLDANRNSGRIVLMPQELIPEGITGEPYTPQTDVFVLGNFILRLMTGRGAFSSPEDVRRSGSRDGRPDLTDDLPPALQAVLIRACAVPRRDRFETPMDFVEAAWSSLQSQPAAVATRVTRPGPWKLELTTSGLSGESRLPVLDTARLAPEVADRISAALSESDFWGEHQPDGIVCAYWHLTVTAADGSRHTQSNVRGLGRLLNLVHQTAAQVPVAVTAAARVLTGHTDLVCAVRPAADGQQLISCSLDGVVRVWDLASGRPIRTVTLKERAIDVAATPEGWRVVTHCRKGALRVRDLASARPVCTLGRDTQLVSSVALSPDGHWLVTGSVSTNSVEVWDLTTGGRLGVLPHEGEVTGVAMTVDGREFLSLTEDGTVRVWDLASGQLVQVLQSSGYADGGGLAVSPDGALVSSSYRNTVRVWELASGRLLATLAGHSAPVLALAFAPDSRRLVSGSVDKTVRVWDVTTRDAVRTCTGHTGPTTSVAFSADGRQVISGSYDKTVRVWDLA